ncbi:MAG: phosphomannomutase/phosphoglucomutase [Planctomycetes bacterium]|jgi:phosphomannomutase|nr:phosphomannomutase/phosphoglucomutase [Planctomycetota bacterium]
MINPNIFKAYDIRGIYPTELNEETAQKIGSAFVTYTKTKQVAIGRDMRLSSEVLFKSLAAGITSAGAEVVDLGLVPIDAVYFAVNRLNFDTGIMITASHNPKEYNGFKMIKKNGDSFDMIRGINIQETVEAHQELNEQDVISQRDIMPEFISYLLQTVDIEKIKPIKIVVDAGNGMAGKTIPLLEKHLPIKVESLFFDLDGSFPNHPSNPLDPESQKAIAARIKETGAMAGFIFDGDSDRIFLVDENGNFIRGDITLIILAEYLLSLPENKGKGIAYNLLCSKSVEEFVNKMGGKAVRTAVGFVNVMHGLKDNNGILGGEVSGHYCFSQNGFADSGYIAWLIILVVLSQSSKPLSQIASELSTYERCPETNITVPSKDEAIEKIKLHFSTYQQDYLDGVTVYGDSWWLNVRGSNTEPLLRITVEAKLKTEVEEKLEEILNILK